jgi:hypothetical protein
MESVCQNLPEAERTFVQALDGGETGSFRKDLDRLDDVKLFLVEAAASCNSGQDLAERIMARHGDVQRGKFDKGRRKMPWIEHVAQGSIALTSTRVGGLRFEATEPTRIIPHLYRLSAGDALNEATRQG